jgi:uncharacterized repeat protein (TIGR02543 family)
LLFGCAKGPKSYTITFELNGGKGEKKLKYNVLSSTFYLQIPYKYEHQFVGWYSQPTFESEKIKKIENGSIGDIRLYAKWTPLVENVVFQELENYRITESIYLGKYPQEVLQDANFVSLLNEKTPDEKGIYRIDDYEFIFEFGNYYFYNLIKWKVVGETDDKYTLLSDRALDFQTFDANTHLYENSFIRSFLNNEFYHRSFNEESKELIIGTFLPENNVTDNVYLPSINEIQLMNKGVEIPKDDQRVAIISSQYSTNYSYQLKSNYSSTSKFRWAPIEVEYFWTRTFLETNNNEIYSTNKDGGAIAFEKDISLYVRPCIEIAKN